MGVDPRLNFFLQFLFYLSLFFLLECVCVNMPNFFILIFAKNHIQLYLVLDVVVSKDIVISYELELTFTKIYMNKVIGKYSDLTEVLHCTKIFLI